MSDDIPSYEDTTPVADVPSYEDTQPVASNDPHQFFTNGTFDVDKWKAAQPKESGPDAEEALLRGGAQGFSAGTQPALSPALERAYAQLFGDQATKDRYAQLSNDDLKKTYVEQNQAALQAHPGAYVGGAVLGSLPASIAAGAGATAAAGNIAKAAELGKYGSAAVQGLTQAGAQGSLGAVTGYNSDPLASDEQKLANAQKGGLTAAAVAGPLAAAAPVAPVLARTAGGALLGGAAANITNPMHPTLGKTLIGMGLGAGAANAAPALINKFGIANDIADANAFGKQGVSLVNKGDVNRVQGQVSDLANQVSNSIGDLDKQVTGPAIQTIQDIHQGALEALTKDLNATPEQAQAMIQNSQSAAINKLETLMAGAQQSGKTVSTGNVIDALTEQLKQDISSSGSVIGDVDRKTVQNAIDNLNTYMTKKGVPIDIKSSTILNSEGKPFLSNLSVGGKNLTADEVKNLINPQTGQLDPAKIQAMGGPNAQVNPVSSSIKTTQMGGENPQGPQIPNTSIPQPQSIPAASISPEDLENGTAMQTVPPDQMQTQYESPEGNAQPPAFTQIDSKQQVIPQEQLSGEMSVPEAQNLKRLMGKMGYDSSSIPDEVKGSFIKANQDLNQVITNAFEPSQPGQTNQYADANAKLTAIHDLGKLVGVPTKLYSTGEQIPSATLQNIIKGVGTSLTDADNGKFQQVVKLLSILDPQGAESFSNNVQQLSGKLAQLKFAGNSPLEQFGGLAEQGMATPEAAQAAQDISQVNTIKDTAGGPSTDVDAQGNQLPSDKSYKFVKNLGQTGPVDSIRSEVNPALKDQMDNTIELLRKFDPDLVDTLETQGKSVARQNELLENNDVNPKSLVGRTGYFIKQGLVRGSNLAGQTQSYLANQNPISSPFFKALPALVQSGAPMLGKYAPALAAAYKRGTNALAATNYSLSQSDPEYRATQDTFNQRFQ